MLHKVALDLTLRRNSQLFPSLELLPAWPTWQILSRPKSHLVAVLCLEQAPKWSKVVALQRLESTLQLGANSPLGREQVVS